MRLDGALAKATGKGRKECREMIQKGRVTVDGIPVKKADFSVNQGNSVCLDGAPLDLREHFYFMLYKPQGTVSTTEKIPESVLSLFPPQYQKRLFCVGRLDKDTTGLLFLTDDGDFDHRLMSPKHHAEKVYFVTLSCPLSAADAAVLEGGMTLENGEKTQPCKVEILTERTCNITLSEGKYHQVKRMFAAVGNRVTALHRISVGGVLLDETLAPGQFRELRDDEVEFLKNS